MYNLRNIASDKSEATIPQAFESNVDFETRFMSDIGLVGCGWAECIGGLYQKVSADRQRTSCQLEVLDFDNKFWAI